MLTLTDCVSAEGRAMELHLIQSESYDHKLPRFSLAGRRHVGDSNVAPWPLQCNSAYIIGPIDASEIYNVKLLRPAPKTVWTTLCLIQRTMEYRTALICTMTLLPLTKLAFSIPLYTLSTNFATLLPTPLHADSLKLPQQG